MVNSLGLREKEASMKYVLSLFLLLSVLVSCYNDKVDPSVTSCAYPGVELRRTTEFIKDVPAIVIAYTPPGTQIINYQIMRGGTSAALGSCSLPSAFAKDSLSVTVSGYLLTFPGMELMNLSPFPFEVTEVKGRD